MVEMLSHCCKIAVVADLDLGSSMLLQQETKNVVYKSVLHRSPLSSGDFVSMAVAKSSLVVRLLMVQLD